MSYVPIVPTPPTIPPSPRARELALLLTKVLDEYTDAHPSTTKAEVQAALRMAQMTRGSNANTVAVTLSLVLGLVALALGAGLFYFRSTGGDMDFSQISPMIIMGIIATLLVVVGIVKIRSG